jgi:hypothetical protein
LFVAYFVNILSHRDNAGRYEALSMKRISAQVPDLLSGVERYYKKFAHPSSERKKCFIDQTSL